MTQVMLRRLMLGLLTASVLTAPPAGIAVAQTPPSPSDADVAGTSALVAALLRQAKFWAAHGDPAQAQASLQRALRVDPKNPDAVALAADLAGPPDHKEADADGVALATARGLAGRGDASEAVVAYQRAFHGPTPPPLLALEYFRTLGQTGPGWEAARDGLATMVRGDPASLDAQLAYAEVLTDRDGAAREDGVARLQALAALPQTAARARLAGAGALLALGRADAAEQMLADVAPSGLSDPERAALLRLRIRLAIGRADALNAEGRQAAAFDVLAPLLAASPADADLTLALARLYQTAKRPRDALATDERVLRRNAGNAEARQEAIDAALAARNRQRAAQLLQEGLRRSPRDPHVWLAAAALAQAHGDTDAALRDLRRARALHQGGPPPVEEARDDRASPPAALALALLSPGDLAPGPDPAPDLAAPPAALIRPQAPDPADGGDDADPVVIRGHMLDTDATEVLPPAVLRARAAANDAAAPAGAAPHAPFAAQQVPSGPTLRATSDTGPVTPMPANPFPVPTTPAAQGSAAQASAGQTPAAPPAPTVVAPTVVAPTVVAQASPSPASDPLGARIDNDIAALTPKPEPDFQASVGFRFRSGTPGLGQLGDLTVPMEATFNSGGDGVMRLSVTPTFLGAGSVPGGAASQAQFGTVALGLHRLPGGGTTGPSISRQTADGTGLDVSYTLGSFIADVGATPLGFEQQNAVGGIQWTPQISDSVRLRLTGERRAVTDSLLSYAGTRDPVSGQTWGGVTLSRGRGDILYSAGPFDLYAGGGGGVLEGRNVKYNSEIEAGAGGSFAAWKGAAQELRLGLDLVYFSYANNLSGFTLGQGGYFSPQSYFAALFPLTFRGHVSPSLAFEVGGTAGVQTYRNDSSPDYPNNGALQAQLEAQQANPATAVPGVTTGLPSQYRTNFTGGAHGSIDYTVTPAFHVGAKVDYEHTGNWNEALGLVYGRYLLGGGHAP